MSSGLPSLLRPISWSIHTTAAKPLPLTGPIQCAREPPERLTYLSNCLPLVLLDCNYSFAVTVICATITDGVVMWEGHRFAAFSVGSIMDIGAMPSRHWQQKAREALEKAKTMTSAEAKRLMRDVARHYREMGVIASRQRRPRRTTRVLSPAAAPRST
jgi:hypothetical protein